MAIRLLYLYCTAVQYNNTLPTGFGAFFGPAQRHTILQVYTIIGSILLVEGFFSVSIATLEGLKVIVIGFPVLQILLLFAIDPPIENYRNVAYTT